MKQQGEEMGGTKELEGHNNGWKQSKYICKCTKLSQLFYKMTPPWGSDGNCTGSRLLLFTVLSSHP